MKKELSIILTAALTSVTFANCRKLVTIDEPINTLTTKEVFSNDAQADAAMVAVYSQMINTGIYSWFSSGSTTMDAGMSADEFNSSTAPANVIAYNRLIVDPNYAPTDVLWKTAYQTVYNANAVVEGIAASTSPTLHDSVRQVLTGEAKFTRALAYFYLVNFYGDVPLVLTVDFNKTAGMVKTPKEQVYAQMVKDLTDAQSLLPDDYSTGKGERIRPNKMAATALLARVYLFTGNISGAVTQASTVIDNTALYRLTTDPNDVFLKNSSEAIYQLAQNTSNPLLGNATPEGITFLPTPLNSGPASNVTLTTDLVDAFETGDRRRSAWIDSSFDNSSGSPAGYFFFPYKYKVGKDNYIPSGGVATEYHMVLRLAEQYLIRADAEANGGPGGTAAAIQDLNVIRARAGLAPLPASLSNDAVLSAVAQERRVELFAEWGHRWFDLKRTGKAHDVLSQISYKQPWQGDFQLLYPIPLSELQADPNLKQNAGY